MMIMIDECYVHPTDEEFELRQKLLRENKTSIEIEHNVKLLREVTTVWENANIK